MKKVMVMFVMVLSLTIVASSFAQDFYATKKGKKYHKIDCPFVANKKNQQVTQPEITQRNLKPCPRCLKDDAMSSGNKKDSISSLNVKKQEKKVN